MTHTYLAECALVDGAILASVGIEIGTDGRIVAVNPGASEGELIPGVVIPGVCNVHSHAFQRAMAGLAERSGSDDFWEWRSVMYRFVAALTPEDVEAIAAQLYVECLLYGYTAVGEFHYLHNAPDGSAYDDRGELGQRIIAAADAAGIGLTLLPVLYRRAGFGAASATEGQRRFVLDTDTYADLCGKFAAQTPVGIAPHSLRAVTPEELQAATALALDLGVPVHIHIAEQEREVADCLAWSGRRPVDLLLHSAPVDDRWCLVHATHINAAECLTLARSGAVVGLCPSTEANLGDGIFPLRAFLAQNGLVAVGSDSNVSTSPVEELRWLDYGQRLVQRGRGTDGHGLLARATAGGAQALGRDAGRIAAGCLADLVVLDRAHPALVGREGDKLLDSWIFSGNSSPVRHVMVAGRWVVRDGVHPAAERIFAAFARSMRRLADVV